MFKSIRVKDKIVAIVDVEEIIAIVKVTAVKTRILLTEDVSVEVNLNINDVEAQINTKEIDNV